MPHGILNSSHLRPRWEGLGLPLGTSLSEKSVFSFWTWELTVAVEPLENSRFLKKIFLTPDHAIASEEVHHTFENVFVLEGLRGLWMSSSLAKERGLTPGGKACVWITTYGSPVTGTPPPEKIFPLFAPVNITDKPGDVFGTFDLDELMVLGLDSLFSDFYLPDFPDRGESNASDNVIVLDDRGVRSLNPLGKHRMNPLTSLRIKKLDSSIVPCEDLPGLPAMST